MSHRRSGVRVALLVAGAALALPLGGRAQDAAAPAAPGVSAQAPQTAPTTCVPPGQALAPGQAACPSPPSEQQGAASAPTATPTATSTATPTPTSTPTPAATPAPTPTSTSTSNPTSASNPTATPPQPVASAASAAGSAGSATAIPSAPSSPPSPPGAHPARAEPREDPDERTAARALERALVEKGGLVVPRWGIEVVPEVGFAYSDGPAPTAASPGGALLGARNEVATASLTLRVGLPLDTQVEVAAPFQFARLVPGGDDPSPPAEASGIGDVRVGLTWHALGGGRLPDVLVGGFWKSRTGKTAFDDPAVRVPLGTGVEQFGGTLALVKAADPVVLIATGTYAVAAPRWIPEGWLEAGDEFGGSAGAVLAVSPETSLSFTLEAIHARPLALEGRTLYRSDRTSAVFRVGVSTLASRHGFFQVNLGMGLTSEVPRFEVSIATPVSF